MSAPTRLAVVPVRDGVLGLGAAEAVAEAAGCALLIGPGAADAAASLAGIAVGTVEVVDDAGPFAAGAWAGRLASHLLARASSPDLVVLPASPDGRDLAPRLAVALDRDLISGAVEVHDDRVLVTRWGGLVSVDATRSGPVVVTLQPGVRGAPDAVGAPPTVEHLDLPARSAVSPPDVTTVEVLPPDAATMDLAEAPRIVGGGAGLGDEATFGLLHELGVALGASVGATRVVTDAGWATHERQIGTTGVVVDPRLYLAFGISGAVQHTAGLGHPAHVVAVNIDPHCPMMAMADLAVVADAPAVLRALVARLEGAPDDA